MKRSSYHREVSQHLHTQGNCLAIFVISSSNQRGHHLLKSRYLLEKSLLNETKLLSSCAILLFLKSQRRQLAKWPRALTALGLNCILASRCRSSAGCLGLCWSGWREGSHTTRVPTVRPPRHCQSKMIGTKKASARKPRLFLPRNSCTPDCTWCITKGCFSRYSRSLSNGKICKSRSTVIFSRCSLGYSKLLRVKVAE